MKVLFCHDGPLRVDEQNNYYGTAHNDKTFTRYYNIAEKLSIVIRVNDISKVEAEEKLSKVTVSPFDVVKCPNISSLKGMIFKKKKAKQVIKDAVMKSDYVIARLPSVIGILAIEFAKKLNKPYLVEVVACPWDAFWNHSLIGKGIAPYMYYATKIGVKDAPHVVYVTNEFLQKRYPTNGKNVNCSNVALQDFDDTILEDRFKMIHQLRSDSKIIIGTTAAVDVRYKGQQFIIKALGALKKQGITRFEYHLVGGGDQSYLKDLAEKYNVSDQVKFIGNIPHNKVFEWLKTIDLYVQPSRQEGLPRALIEAMSFGLPCFGANTAGIPELLQEKYIFSNSKKNIGEICKILKLMTKDIMLQQAERNYKESKKYDKRVIEERRLQFFNEFKRDNESNNTI